MTTFTAASSPSSSEPRRILGDLSNVNDTNKRATSSKIISTQAHRPSSSRIPFRPKNSTRTRNLDACASSPQLILPPPSPSSPSPSSSSIASTSRVTPLSDLETDTEDEDEQHESTPLHPHFPSSSSSSEADHTHTHTPSRHPVYFGTPSKDERHNRRQLSKQVRARRLLRRDSLELGRRSTLTMEEVQCALDDARRESRVAKDRGCDEEEDGDADDTAKACDQQDVQDNKRQRSDTAGSSDGDHTLHLPIAQPVAFDEMVDFDRMEQEYQESAIPQAQENTSLDLNSHQETYIAADIPQHVLFDDTVAFDQMEQRCQDPAVPQAPANASADLDSNQEIPPLITSSFDETVAFDLLEESHEESATEEAQSHTSADLDSNQEADTPPHTPGTFDETIALDIAEQAMTSQVLTHPPLASPQQPHMHRHVLDETLALDSAEERHRRDQASDSSHDFFDETVAFGIAEDWLEEGDFDDTIGAQASHAQEEDHTPDDPLAMDILEDAVGSETHARSEALSDVDHTSDTFTPPHPPVFDETVALDATEDRIAQSTPEETPLLNPLQDPTASSLTSFSLDSPGIGRSRVSNGSSNDIIHHQPWSPAQARDRRNSASFDLTENPKSASAAAFSPLNVRQIGTPLSERSTNILPNQSSPHMHKLREVRDALLLRSPAKVRSAQQPGQHSPARKPPQRIMISSPPKPIHRPEVSSPAKAIRHIGGSPGKQLLTVQRPPSPVKIAPAKAQPSTFGAPKPSVAANHTATSLSRIARPTATTQQHRQIAVSIHRQQQQQQQATPAPSAPNGRRIIPPGSTQLRMTAAPRPGVHRPSSSTSSTSSSGGSEMTRLVKRAVPGTSSTSRIGVPVQASKLPAVGGGIAQQSTARPAVSASKATTNGPLYKKHGALPRPPQLQSQPLSQPPSQPQQQSSPPKPTSNPARPRVNLSGIKILRQAHHHTTVEGERPRARRVAADSREAVFAAEREPAAQPTQPQPTQAPAHVPARPFSPVKTATMPVPDILPILSGKSIRPRRSQAAMVPEKADVFSVQDELGGEKDEEKAATAVVQSDEAEKETEPRATSETPHASSQGSDTPGGPSRRTSSRRAVPRSSVGPASARRPGKQADAVPSVPISSSALASLTTRNSRKNESFYARIEVQVMRMDCPRPPSPTSKIRRSSSATTGSRQDKGQAATARADRAKKRAAEIVAGEGSARGAHGCDGEGEGGEHSVYEWHSSTHRLGAGDTEPYSTPIRRSGRRQVRWHRGLFAGPRTVGMREEDTWPNKSNMVRKAYGLDRHGNVRAADGPPEAAWCAVVVPVRKMIYEDDSEEE